MSVLLVCRPHRTVTFAIERKVTRLETEIAAIAELDATDPVLFEVMARAET